MLHGADRAAAQTLELGRVLFFTAELLCNDLLGLPKRAIATLAFLPPGSPLPLRRHHSADCTIQFHETLGIVLVKDKSCPAACSGHQVKAAFNLREGCKNVCTLD